jgi:valyl-tRNA synthetase
MTEVSKPALDAVMNSDIHLHPSKFKNLYRHWMENVHDWCISRQLWWGQRIPAWYYDEGEFVVAENEKQALELARKKSGKKTLQISDLHQDDDVLDTWFSSWLWPITCFDGINDPDNRDYNYYYPTNDLITAPDILFFWVARMIIAGYEYRKEKPFSNVYLTGLVRDMQRRKMSKSLGNSPEPIDLIERYGADGVRVGMLLCSPAGNDLLYDDSLPEQGRNFANKIWNAFRLVKHWHVDESIKQPEASATAVKWMNEVLKKSLHEIDLNFKKFRISEAMMISYKLFWDEFSGWYLEIIKPDYQKPIDKKTYDATIDIFEKLVEMIHPFMPFITEEIWQMLRERKTGESVMVARLPEARRYNKELLASFENIKETVSAVRTVRKEKDIPNKETVELRIMADSSDFDKSLLTVVSKLCNLSAVTFISARQEGAAAFMIGTTQYFIPLEGKLDVEAELTKLGDDLVYNRGFLATVMKKLENERFVQNAPASVIELERKKKSDAEAKIKSLEERISHLKKMS